MRGKLSESIVTTTLLFAAAQAILYPALSALSGAHGPWAGGSSLLTAIPGNPLFYPVSAAIHGALLFFLLRSKADFKVEATGRELERVNLANALTMVRVSTLPTILFLVLEIEPGAKPHDASIYSLAILSALVFLTDLLDGFVSRTMKQGTRVGRMLDSASDYCLLGVFSVLLLHFGLVASWFFAVIAARLLFQGLGMGFFILLRKPVEPRPTLMGKVAVATAMVFYAATIARPVAPPSYGKACDALQVIACIVIGASIADKAIVFARHGLALWKEKADGGNKDRA